MDKNICCFFGHRKIDISDKIESKVYNIVKQLIVEEDINTFLFGSKSEFNDLCYLITTKLKTEHSYIKRIYVRAENPYINSEYESYLLRRYEDTYYPDSVVGAGRSAYVERNYEMIDKSKICIVYYDENYVPINAKKTMLNEFPAQSGTKLAYDYAKRKQRRIINIFDEINLL